MRYLIQITLPYACAGIEVDAPSPYGIVIKTAPIFSWMRGKFVRDIENWVIGKRGFLQYQQIE